MLPSVDELKERYSSWSNGRLLGVLHNKEEYTAEAIEVARAELGQRNITTDDVDVFLEEMEQRRMAVNIRSSTPLTFGEKARYFFFWFVPLFLGRSFRIHYRKDGFLMKDKQSHSFAIAGFAFLLLVGIVTVYFQLRMIASGGIFIMLFLLFVRIERRFTYDLSPIMDREQVSR